MKTVRQRLNIECLAWLALLVLTTLSRILVAPDILYEWDSANYALALRDFDVYEHQPHPPGYPLFVGLLRLAGYLTSDPATTPFLLVNSLLTVLTLGLVGYVARPRLGARGAWLLALAFAACPTFWHHGAASTAYVTECFASTLMGVSALLVAERRIKITTASVVFVIAYGLRPTAAISLLPVALWACVLARPHAHLALAAGIAFLGARAWAGIAALSNGGWQRYREACGALWDWQLDVGSILGDAGTSRVAAASKQLFTYIWDATNLALPVLAVLIVAVVARRRVEWRKGLLFALWVAGPAALYVLHHMPKSGYVLTLVPPCFLAFAYLVPTATGDLAAKTRRLCNAGLWAGLCAYLAFNITGFFVAVPRQLLHYHDAPDLLPSRVFMTGDYGRIALEYRTEPHRRVRSLIGSLDDDDLAIFLFRTHVLYRVASYYYPQARMAAVSFDHGVALANRSEGPWPWTRTFGDFERLVLARPKRRTEDALTMSVVARAPESSLALEAAGSRLSLPLSHPPRRILIFYPCPPCYVNIGNGISPDPVEVIPIAAGYGAAILHVKGSSRLDAGTEQREN